MRGTSLACSRTKRRQCIWNNITGDVIREGGQGPGLVGLLGQGKVTEFYSK